MGELFCLLKNREGGVGVGVGVVGADRQERRFRGRCEGRTAVWRRGSVVSGAELTARRTFM